MKDYIEIPTIVKEIKEIYSNNLQNLINESDIEGNKISLASLRDLYKKDRNRFIQVVDELLLRGFVFHTEKPTNILPHRTADFSTYIKVHENENKYENVNWNRVGVSGFLKRFHVEADLFFHKIPLSGFKTINGNINLEELEEELEKAGFTILSVEEESKGSSPSLPLNHSSSNEVTQLLKTIPLSRIFEENKYNTFRSFCLKKEFESLLDITDQAIYEYSKEKSVGAGRILDVVDRLNEIKALSLEELAAVFPDEDAEMIDLDNKYAGDTLITDLFRENKFNKFIEFCEHNGILKVSDIQHRHIEEFSKEDGVGKKKVEDVQAMLEAYSESAEQISTLFESGEFYEAVKDKEVSELFKAYQIEPTIDRSVSVAEIQGKEIEELENQLDGKALIALSGKLKNQKSPQTIVSSIGTVLSERELEVLQLRLKEGLTLEATAQNFDVTRERIRQIEQKAIRKVIQYLELSNFESIIKILSPSSTLINGNTLEELIGSENDFILGVLKGKNSFFSYYDKLDVYYFNQQDHDSFNELEDLINDLPESFYLYDYESSLEEILENNGMEDTSPSMIEKLLQKFGYNKYSEFYSRYKLHINDVLSQIFKQFIKTPLKLDEAGVEKLQTLARRHLDYELDGSVRSIDARLRDAENVILVDRATFQWFESESFDMTIIHKVNAYLQTKLETQNVINVEEVFHAFETELREHNIFYKLHLYSLIRYYLDEEYDIGQGNTLNIFRKDGDKLSTEDIMIESIKKLGGICSKEALREELRWQQYKIDLTISTSYKLVPWGTNQVTYFEYLNLSEEEKTELIHLVQQCVRKGYTTTAIIYKELMFNRKLASLINQKGIDDHGKLAAIVKILVPNLKGHINFLFLEDAPYKTFEEVIIHTFRDLTTRSEIREFAMEHGYKEMMASNLLKKLMEQEAFIEVGLDELCPADKFYVEDDVILKLKEFTEESMNGRDYISLSNLKGYRRKLPSLEDFRWNAQIMKSLLVKQGYRQISKIYNDYRYDKVILVKEESSIQTFEELVYHILKNEYEGNMHEIAIYDFLVERGVVREQPSDYKKVLPYEIKNYDNLVNVDELGFVTLK